MEQILYFLRGKSRRVETSKVKTEDRRELRRNASSNSSLLSSEDKRCGEYGRRNSLKKLVAEL